MAIRVENGCIQGKRVYMAVPTCQFASPGAHGDKTATFKLGQSSPLGKHSTARFLTVKGLDKCSCLEYLRHDTQCPMPPALQREENLAVRVAR